MDIENKDFSDRCYFSKDASFLWRNINSSFRTKWCGIWNGDIKYFEYFAYKINEVWITPNLCEKTSVLPSQTRHTYKSQNNLSIKETIFPHKNSIISVLSFKNAGNVREKINIQLECAVNIREKGENWHMRTYNSSKNDLRKCVIASSVFNLKKYYAIYGCGNVHSVLKKTKTAKKNADIKISLKENYKDHYPNSKQRCFLSSDYTVEVYVEPNEEIQIPFIFSCAQNQKDLYGNYDELVSGWFQRKIDRKISFGEKTNAITTPDKYMDNAFAMAQHSLLSMVHKTDFGEGMFAGFPWFLSFWSRDICWSLLGLNALGFLDKSKNIMSTIASFYNEEKDKKLFSYGINGLPTKITMNKEPQYYSCDLNPLFLSAYMNYLSSGGKKERIFEVAKSRMEHNLRLINYIVDTNTQKNQQKVEHTWMDTIIRCGTPIEVQALWTNAMKGNEKFFEKMKQQLNASFFNEKKGYLYDTYNAETKAIDNKIRPNALVALMFNLMDKEKADAVLRVAEKELHNIYGISTLSKNDTNYTSDGYHNGSSWGLTSMWGACAYLNYGYREAGLTLLEQISRQSVRGNPYGFDECNDSHTGVSLGASPQCWSAGLFIYAIDNCLFGIRGEENNIISIDPKLPEKWLYAARLEKTMKNSLFDMNLLRRKKGKLVFVQMDLAFKKGAKTNLIKIMRPRKKMDVVNGIIKASNDKYTLVEVENKTGIMIEE